MENNPVYIPYNFVQRIVYLLSVTSVFALMFMNYSVEYKWVVLLPIVYMFSLYFFLKRFMLQGIGSIALVGMYAFRMCLLPVLCAYGNFYIEPSKSIYMPYFGLAIILMCAECIIVFATLSHYSKKYQNRIVRLKRYKDSSVNDSILIIFSCMALLVYAVIIYTHPGFLVNHYHFLISSADDASLFALGNALLENYGAAYYLAIILDITARPIASFALVNWALKRNSFLGIVFSICIGLFNILWISDRRILSLLVGACCLLQVLFHMRSKITKHTLYWMIGFFAILTIVYCFWGEDTPLRVARKFQRYFSGPSLTAIGIAVYYNYFQTPVGFLKLLFNDSIILSGLFDSVPIRNYVMELCGPTGYSIWTPMFIGAIQYFHFLAPVMIVGVVKYLVYTDYRSRTSQSDFRKMMFNYLSIAISVYMVMYTIDLVYYNIFFIGGFFYLLLSVNKKITFVFNLDE